MKLSVDDIQGVFGIMPTPATLDGNHWSTENSVNFAETERMVKLLKDAGIHMLATAGTFGECASLTTAELQDFTRCVADANAGSRPYFAGITTLNTRDTISRGKALIDAGADALFVGRPMWLALDQRAIVRYYEDVAEALPGIPLMAYDNQVAFKGKISKEAYAALAEIPEVIAAKHTGGPPLLDDARAVGKKMRVLPLATSWYEAAKAEPEMMKACWSGAVACAPAPTMALAEAIMAGQWEKAKAISDRCNWAESAMFAKGGLEGFMDYSIQIAHLRHATAGLVDPGPPRPPYHLDPPEAYLNGGKECGQRWAELQREFCAETV